MAETRPPDVDAGRDAVSARALAMRRSGIFCLVAFALAGMTAVVLASTGGLADARVLVPGTPATVALVLLPTACVFSSAAAHVATRSVTREGWSGTGLRPRLRGGRTAAAERSVGGALPISVSTLLVLQPVAAVTPAPLVNAFVAVGEELGWRAYLQPHLVDVLGVRRGVVLTGVVWRRGTGRWSSWATSTVTATPAHRGSGCWCSWSSPSSVETLLGAVAVRGGGVWPAALGHGAVSATATLPMLVTASSPDLPVGPPSIGAAGVLPRVAVAAVLLPRWPRGRSVETPAAGR